MVHERDLFFAVNVGLYNGEKGPYYCTPQNLKGWLLPVFAYPNPLEEYLWRYRSF